MIARNIEKIRESISSGVELIAVSKFHPIEDILKAYQVGQRVFGESRLQELKIKVSQLPKDIEWHFIGHLQRKKVKEVIHLVDTIQSVDSINLLTEIQKYCQLQHQKIKCLLQVYVGDENTKQGLSLDECREIFETRMHLNSDFCEITGIMTMATNTDDLLIVKKEFETVHNFFEELKSKYETSNFRLKTLSMGMSHDFQLAIEEGSNMIRVGSLIFGERNY